MEAIKKGSKDRYGQEGIVRRQSSSPRDRGARALQGAALNSIYQLVGGLKAGMGYLGTARSRSFRDKSAYVRITPAGLRECHVHDVIITQEAPNYRLE